MGLADDSCAMKIARPVDPQACSVSQERNGNASAVMGAVLGATQLAQLGAVCGPAALPCAGALFIAGGIGGYYAGKKAGENLTADFANACRLDQFDAPAAAKP